MFTGVRAVCSCGAVFPLPQEAFTSGTTCPGCGHEATRSELEAYRPAGVSEFTRKSSIVVIAVLVLGELWLLARGLLGGNIEQMATLFRDLGRSLPALTTLTLCPGWLPGLLTALAIACVGVAVAGWRTGRDTRRRDLGTSAWLLAFLALSVFVATLVTLAIRLPLIDLIESLN